MKKETKEEIKDQSEENVKKGVNKILICLIILVLLIGVYIVVININKEKSNEKFASEYTSVTKENVFVYKDIDEIIETLENGTGIVYFGYPECKWCQAYVTILNEVAKEKGIKEIDYFNIREDRKNNSSKYQKIVELLKDQLDKDANGNPRVFVPEVVVVVDGKIVGRNNETATIADASLTPEKYWTTEKTEELENELSTILSKINICIDCNE